MYKRLSAVLFPILAVAIVGLGLWGYRVNHEKNTVLIKAENQYQRAFHDLSYHVDKLHEQLGQALAVSPASDQFQRKSLTNVWRITSEAQSEINQLPLTLLPFNTTEEFLSNVAKFSYNAAVRDMTKQPLSEDELKTMSALYERSKEIAAELRDVQTKVIENNLRWMDVEMALATEKETQDNTIIDGFKTVNKQVGEYEEINWGPSVAGIYKVNGFQNIAGEELTPEQIKQKAAEFFGLGDTTGMEVVENGAGTEFNSYSVSMPTGPNRSAHIDFTKRGGHPIWFINERMVSDRGMELSQTADAAQRFLQAHGFADLVPVTFDEYQNTASLTFARKKDGVVIYPEKLVVQVAMDNGEVMGLHANDYLHAQKERQLKAPAISAEEAKSKLNSAFQTSSHSLALITNELNEETLCHQFTGRINGSQYRVYVNADTGIEEKIEEIRHEDIAAGR